MNTSLALSKTWWSRPASPSCDGPAEPLDIAALIGPSSWARLPALVQQRFCANHGDADYVGQMDFDCSFIGRCFALMARVLGGPLVASHATAMPTVVRVCHDDAGGMVWERRFQTSSLGAQAIVRSTKAMGPHGKLIERTQGGLSMALDVFEDSGSLVFESRGFALSLGRWWVPIPSALSPGVCRVTHTDLQHGRFRFTLEMIHPWWGRTFRQTGTFVDPAGSAA